MRRPYLTESLLPQAIRDSLYYPKGIAMPNPPHKNRKTRRKAKR